MTESIADHMAEPVRRVPLVGVGASAGGLEPMERFFAACGPIEHCAFVVIQHLSPTQPSLLPELLQRSTTLPVLTVKDAQKPLPGHVYVVPPGVEVRLHEGLFRLAPQSGGHKAPLPIDVFFVSLASECRELGIGVVLSGMGTDGTDGLRVLKKHAGAGFAQTPATAEFDSMPRSAIGAGLIDGVADAAHLPQHIARHLEAGRPDAAARERTSDPHAFDAIVRTLGRHTGHDFSMYKKSTLRRRIERRMTVHRHGSIAVYEAFLRNNPAEADLLFKEVLIGVTSFFRDAVVWEHLANELVPGVLAKLEPGSAVRIWVPGCSTGEEVYSLAMVVLEAIEAHCPDRALGIRIFATDIDKDAILRARTARYPRAIASDVSAARLARFFVPDEHGYRVRKEVRETVIFALQNVAMDPPFTKLDMLVCRNLLIYFEPELQRRLLPLFHYSLEPGGLLVLGTAETVGASSEHFEAMAGKSKVFRRIESMRRPGFVAFPAATGRRRHTEIMVKKTDNQNDPIADKPNLQSAADHLLLQNYAPAAVLATQEGDVVYVSGKTGRYLEAAAGKANWNVLAMARDGLRAPLSQALREALHRRRSVRVDVLIVDDEGGKSPASATVDPVTSPGTLAGMVMIVFTSADPRLVVDVASGTDPAVPGNVDLLHARESLRLARREAQDAQEESRATNEELQSTNEELQSANEELTTSKEEMQSMNEELRTVNQELQSKLDELSQASDDMHNLLNSTDIATLFLDESLRIRRFTPQATSLFKLISGDIGRPITDITNELDNWTLADEARIVLESSVFRECDVAASGKRWFKVRTMPYRTSSNRTDGVVITFSDITRAKHLELELQATQRALESRLADRSP